MIRYWRRIPKFAHFTVVTLFVCAPIAAYAPDTLASVLVVLWLAAMGAFMLLRKKMLTLEDPTYAPPFPI